MASRNLEKIIVEDCTGGSLAIGKKMILKRALPQLPNLPLDSIATVIKSEHSPITRDVYYIIRLDKPFGNTNRIRMNFSCDTKTYEDYIKDTNWGYNYWKFVN